MNKKLILLLSVFVGLVAISVAYVATRPSSKATVSDTTIATSPPQIDDVSETSTGRYITYTPEAVAATPGEKVLFFYAPWCSQCRSIDAGIDGQVPNDLTIFKVDYDSNQALRQKYGVTLQTTFVKIDDEGKLISKYVAYDDPYFPSVKKNYL